MREKQKDRERKREEKNRKDREKKRDQRTYISLVIIVPFCPT